MRVLGKEIWPESKRILCIANFSIAYNEGSHFLNTATPYGRGGLKPSLLPLCHLQRDKPRKSVTILGGRINS